MQNLRSSGYGLIMGITLAASVTQLYCAGAGAGAGAVQNIPSISSLEKAFDWGQSRAIQYGRESGQSQAQWYSNANLLALDVIAFSLDTDPAYKAEGLKGHYGVSFDPEAFAEFRRGFLNNLNAVNKALKKAHQEAIAAEKKAREEKK